MIRLWDLSVEDPAVSPIVLRGPEESLVRGEMGSWSIRLEEVFRAGEGPPEGVFALQHEWRAPQTAVGKIFKPYLVQLEVQDVYSQEVSAVDGVAGVDVNVGPHKLHGIVADVQVTAGPAEDKEVLEEAIDQVLGQYAVHYQLTVNSIQ